MPKFFMFSWLLFGFLGITWAQSMSFVPTLPVKSYILINAKSGEVLAEQAADIPYPPASLTKLMTAYLVYAALKKGEIGLDQQVKVTENAWRMGGSRMYIDPRSRVTVDQLLNGLVVQSGNDAATALAELLAGSEATFAQKMNQAGQELGLRESIFTNASGLPEPADGQMSARDIALLARKLLENFPEQYYRYSLREFTYNNISQNNRNALLWENFGVDGLKTGYTKAAGYCLAASVNYGDLRLIAVVMGTESPKDRVALTRALLTFGTRQYQQIQLFAPNVPLTVAPVYLGQQATVSLAPQEAVSVVGRSASLSRWQLTIDYPQGLPLRAPLTTTTPVAELVLREDAQILGRWPLYPQQAIAETGWFGHWWQRWQRFWQASKKS
jgi:D-alanyl-D-alanine carboxypeptidase (penicillin-binding protein 5/6)